MLTGPRKALVVYGLALAALATDQASKAAVRAHLAIGQAWQLTDGLALHYVKNQGAAFSLLEGHVGLLAIVSIGVVLGMIYFERRRRALPRLAAASLGILLGGTAGNMMDRLVFGAVTDFLDVFVGRYHWPIFNLADVCINAGVLGLLFVTLRPPASALEDPRR